MQGNGVRIAITALFLVLSGWYLFPTLQNYFNQQKLESLSAEERAAYEQENYAEIRETREKALKLGLDLQGGMHVALEVGVGALIEELASDTDEAFDAAIAAARAEADAGSDDFIGDFVDAFEAQDAEARLSRYFRSVSGDVNRRSSNEEVEAYLRSEANEAVTRAMAIIRDRVDRYGVTEPSIQKQGERRVIVELPGVDDPERVRNLLKGTARLEFRLMADPQALGTALNRVIAYYDDVQAPATEADTTAAVDADTTGLTDTADLLTDDPIAQPANPLLAVLQPGQGVVFGVAAERDTAAVNRLIADPQVKRMIPPGVTLMWTTLDPLNVTADGTEFYNLLGVRENVEMTGEVITDASVEFSQTNQAEVSMVMNGEGARDWARITGANIQKPVAIVLDNVVYSYPVVQNKIVGGRSSITGLGALSEAEDIVTVLKSGALPAPVEIVEERTVGPSLGAASIRAGTTSVVIGLLLVIVFMVFYYRTAGLVADVALILNIIFVFGILAGFNATLTLPGIAGIVLTIGMAVDANVLIFERIREEMSTGKTMKAAIEAGYANAYSAIADANITTFLVGVILYSFGVGPIQGFAVTLMAGILSSLFTAIVVTRILFDWMVSERKMTVSYG